MDSRVFNILKIIAFAIIFQNCSPVSDTSQGKNSLNYDKNELFILNLFKNQPVGVKISKKDDGNTRTTYYIDATEGDDSNDGESPDTPFQTIKKINSMSFLPGDTILFKRSGIWREQLIIPSSGEQNNAITFGAYGEGEQPKIHNTVVINGEDWNDYDFMAGFGGTFGENGDFEDPDDLIGSSGAQWFAAPFNGGSYTQEVTDTVYSGKSAVILHKATGGSTVFLGNNIFSAPGSKFNLRFFGKTDTNTTIDIQIRAKTDEASCQYLQSDGSWQPTAYWFNNVVGTDTDWMEVTKEFLLPDSDSENIILWQIWVRLNNDGDAWVDNFRLESKWVKTKEDIYRISLNGDKRSILIDGQRCNYVDKFEDLTRDKDVFYETHTYYVWNDVSPEFDTRTFEWIKSGYPALLAVNKDNLVIDNISFRGGDISSEDYQGMVILKNCNHIIVDNCTIKGTDGSGIIWSGENASFTNNRISEACGSGGINITRISGGAKTSGAYIAYNKISNIGNSRLDTYMDGHAISLSGGMTYDHTIRDVMIEHNEMSNSGKFNNGGQATGPYNCEFVTIRYNKIYNNYSGGIIVGTGSKNTEIYGNLIYNNNIEKDVAAFGGGICVTMSNVTNGLPPSHSIDNLYIYNNLIYNNDDHSDCITGGKRRAGILFFCATAFDADGDGEPDATFEMNNVVVKNNIVFNNYTSAGEKGKEIYWIMSNGTCVSDIDFDNNLYYRTRNSENFIYFKKVYTLDQFTVYQTEQGQDLNSLAENPMFVDTDINNFHLQPNSPCIDRAILVDITDNSILTDFDGISIPQGDAPDMGIFEFHTSN